VNYAHIQLNVAPLSLEDYYLDTQSRRRLAQATQRIVRAGVYTNSRGEDVSLATDLAHIRTHQKTITAHQTLVLPAPRYAQTMTFVHQQSVIDVARAWALRGFKVGILHHVDVQNDLGAYEDGAHTQATSLLRSSMLAAGDQISVFAQHHLLRTAPLYDHTVVYTPRVPFIRTHVGDLLDQPWHADIVSVVPPQVSLLPSASLAELPLVLYRRLERAWCLWAQAQVNVVVMGGWGIARAGVNVGLFHDTLSALLSSECSRSFAAIDLVFPGGHASQAALAQCLPSFHRRIFPSST
jgi:uncharacterized protein (TIGR02452 family)